MNSFIPLVFAGAQPSAGPLLAVVVFAFAMIVLAIIGCKILDRKFQPVRAEPPAPGAENSKFQEPTSKLVRGCAAAVKITL